MEWTQEEINRVYEVVMNKAATDEEFREKLLANPNAAIEELSGDSLPDGFRVKVLENDPNYAATFVLPKIQEATLSVDELESVAGGMVNVCGAQAQVQVK